MEPLIESENNAIGMTQKFTEKTYGVVKLADSDKNAIVEQFNGYENNLNIDLVAYSDYNTMTVYQSGNAQVFEADLVTSKGNQILSYQGNEGNKSTVELDHSNENTLISKQEGISNAVAVTLVDSDENSIYTDQSGDENTAYYFIIAGSDSNTAKVDQEGDASTAVVEIKGDQNVVWIFQDDATQESIAVVSIEGDLNEATIAQNDVSSLGYIQLKEHIILPVLHKTVTAIQYSKTRRVFKSRSISTKWR